MENIDNREIFGNILKYFEIFQNQALLAKIGLWPILLLNKSLSFPLTFHLIHYLCFYPTPIQSYEYW